MEQLRVWIEDLLMRLFFFFFFSFDLKVRTAQTCCHAYDEFNMLCFFFYSLCLIM
ncbi:hypothetical protein HanIR_Chr08g0368661 [Helianthus annuus]|nr:hypothetical protein HanIR_Chr08g0368661 [Helianthus annuus]